MKFATLEKAVSHISDGDLITFSGVELNRAPMTLIHEIARQKKRILRLISIPNPLAVDVLIKEGCVKHVTSGFNGFSCEEGFVIAPNWKRAIENSLVEWKETDIFEIIQALRAGSLNIKDIEVPNFKNSDYLKVNNYRKVKKNNEEVVLTKAIKPDYALIHAQYANHEGDVLIEDPLIDKLIANASKNIIVSVEKVIKNLKEITIFGEKIDYIVEARNGALPTSCFKFYNYDLVAIREYLGEIVTRKNKGEEDDMLRKKRQISIDNIIITLAELIKDNSSVATGVASPLPMTAVMLAKRIGKRFDYFNCGSGALNPVINAPEYSSVTINALKQKESFIELPDVWDFALKGDIDMMFFGAVQIAKNGDVNITCIGDYRKPKAKLPGPAGAVTLRGICKSPIIVVPNHTKRVFVEKVDFVTSGTTKDTIAVTNLGVLKLGKLPEILFVYPNSSIKEIKDNTGFVLSDKNARIKDINENEIKLLNEIDRAQIRYRFA